MYIYIYIHMYIHDLFTSQDLDLSSAQFLLGFVVSANLLNTDCGKFIVSKRVVSAIIHNTFSNTAQEHGKLLARNMS